MSPWPRNGDSVPTTVEECLANLPEVAKTYLGDLVRRWGFLSDLCFSDLLVYLPTPDSLGFTVGAQARPATAQTVHAGDLVGVYYDSESVPAVATALRSGNFAFSEWVDPKSGHMVVSHCIPLRAEGLVFGVLARDYMLNPQRIQGELESTYLNIFERFAKMILAGDYPYRRDESGGIPRVGDGVILLDGDGSVTFLSPNGVSALHRLGCGSPSLSRSLSAQGVDLDGPRRSSEMLSPVLEEVEGPQDSAVTFYCMPLIERGSAEGYLLLVQDVTNIRRSERLLLSKDATIREVHHRVKNNLQTISSLLRLQGRRVESVVAKAALGEAERRIRSIAVVHEVLSREIGEVVPMTEIVEAIVHLARESTQPGRSVEIEVVGALGDLDAGFATPLAVVLQELLLNSLEHALPEELGDHAVLRVELRWTRGPEELTVEVIDNGVGFPEGFNLESTTSLGLLIVRDLVRSQLMGILEIQGPPGAVVRIRIPKAVE
jgi:two-component sensor histidine kinase